MAMRLDSIDQALLDGAHGATAALAMRMLTRYGEAAGAEAFVSVASAHIDGCLYHGQSSLDFARRFVELGGRVRVPTSLNVGAADVVHPEWHCGPPELLTFQRELTGLHEQLGCTPTLTCAPYQRLIRPQRGEHVAWGESNAIVFANSVLGARTDRYGDFADLCAALTGRVPLTGYHLDENRRPQCAIEAPTLDHTELSRDLYFSALGYIAGQRIAGRTPMLLGMPADATEDELKAFGAAGASAGALALFHAHGVTPEAHLHDVAGLPRIAITAEDMRQAIAALCPLVIDEPVAALCVGTPHYSIEEFRTLARAVRGHTRAPGAEVFASTSREIAAAVDAAPEMQPLRDFGVNIVVDTCTYLAPVVRAREGAIVTTSAKYAHYGPVKLHRRVGMMPLERCIRSVELGRVAP